ncbi:MAG: GAF domain-containing protein, partial [Acidobacteriia bacterium]|nr:GAF domain-containing protein [Terriglobia bacterium]
MLKSVSACLRREIKHDFAALALYNAELHELRLHALDFPDDPAFLKQGQLIPLVGTPASLAFSSRKAVLRHRPDFNEFPADLMKQAYARGIKSGCAVPLICHDKIVGSMVLASLRESAFTEDDAELLTQIGTQVAIAVDNAQNFEKARFAQQQMERERDRSKLLLEVNNAVVSHLNLTELLRSVSPRLQELMFNDSVFIALCSPGETLEMLAIDLGRLGDAPFKEGMRIPIEGTPEEKAIRTGRGVLMRSVADIEKFPSPWVRYGRDHGVRSGCVNPLIAHGRTLGALGIVSLRDDTFTPESARLLEEISGQIAIAVENALNFENARTAEREAKQERDRSKLLLEVNNAVISHLNRSDLLKSVSARLRELMFADSVFIALCAPNNTIEMRALDLGKIENVAFKEGLRIPIEGTPEEEATKTGCTVLLRSVEEIQKFTSPWAIPFSTLRNVDLDDSFSAQKRAVISKLRYDSASHVFLQSRSRFWIEQGISGFA